MKNLLQSINGSRVGLSDGRRVKIVSGTADITVDALLTANEV